MINTITDTINSLEFEQYFIIAAALAAIFVFYNILKIAKFIYAFITRKKALSEDPANEIFQEEFVNEFNSREKKKSIFRKTASTVGKVLGRVLRPFNFRWFRKHLFQRKIINIFGQKIAIPNLTLHVMSYILINFVFITTLFLFINRYFLSYPNYTAVFPKEGEIWNDYKKPITIEFDVPINKEKLIINMNPEEQQEQWVFEKSFSFLPFTRTIKYYPKETIYPDEKVMVYFTDLTNHFQTSGSGEHLIEYKSISLPEVVSTQPENGQIDISPETDIILNLNQDDGDYVDWDIDFNRPVEYTLNRDNSNKVTISLDKKLLQGKEYQLTVYEIPISTDVQTGEVTRRGERKEVKKLSFTTVKPPGIEEFEPNGTNVLPSQDIKVVFDNKMDRSSVEKLFSIKPELKGTIKWKNDKTFIFTPKEGLPKATHFKVVFDKGLKSSLGGYIEEEIVYEFDTIGRVKVIGWLPGYNAGNISVASSVNVTFNQQVDHPSAQSKFSISPNISGSFTWNGNTMTFNPNGNLGYQTTYNISVASGVKTIHGLNSNQSFHSHFTTESQVFTLNVPQYYQSHAFTCNVTATAMALSYKGASSSEMGVYNGIAKDSTSCTKDADGNITYWGNPNSGYVGSIDGGGDCGGYGVHWSPVASYISSRGRSAQVISGWSAAQVAQEVQKGNPIIIWGQNGWASATWKSWNSPTGQVNALNGMHSEVVIGFIGSPNNPSHILTNDPWRGRRTLTVDQFYGVWGYFGRRGVVVR